MRATFQKFWQKGRTTYLVSRSGEVVSTVEPDAPEPKLRRIATYNGKGYRFTASWPRHSSPTPTTCPTCSIRMAIATTITTPTWSGAADNRITNHRRYER